MLQPRTVRDLPENYQEVFFLRVTDRQKILMLNVGAILVMIVSGFIFVGLLLLYHALGAPFVINSLPDDFPPLIGIAIVLGMMPVHEWVHGLAIQFYGHPVRYGVKVLKGVLYATADGAYFWRSQFFGVALAPLVVLSSLGLLIGTVLPAGAALWIMFAVTLNATGAIGDLWMVWAIRVFPPDALIRDEEDGVRVFTRARSEG